MRTFNRRIFSYAMILLILLFGSACSAGGGNPVIPSETSDLTDTISPERQSDTLLWGVYTCLYNGELGKFETTLHRNASFTANVTGFLNTSPTGLGISINSVSPGTGYTDIDIDISLTHPFPGAPQYNGYDVRGVFMGNGSSNLQYNPDLAYPTHSVDQSMLADPLDGYGGPDGYTRWFNLTEFTEGGMPLLQYIQGNLANPDFSGTATLNPYKYFADSLGDTEDLWTWLNDHPDQKGVFSSGATNTRNYYLRFPQSTGISFGYAIIADWDGPEPGSHPSNATEAVAVNVTDNSNLYYEGPGEFGGDLNLDISVWNWHTGMTSVVMEDYSIFIESTVLNNTYQLDSLEMVPTGGDENFSTFHTEISADLITGIPENDFWVIVEQSDGDYTNDFGIPNLADTDPLAAFFRYDLDIAGEQQNTPPEIHGITDDVDPEDLNTELNDSYSEVTYIVDFTDPDPDQTHTIKWYIEDNDATELSEPDDAMPYDWTDKEYGSYKIWVTVDDGVDLVTGGPYVVRRTGWVRTWGAGYQDRIYDVEIDSEGNVYSCGFFYYNCDFDPDPVDEYFLNSNGNRDSFVSKFDSDGDFLWAGSWGGNVSFGGMALGIAVDSDDNVLISGYFYGDDVDFDPGPGEDLHSATPNDDPGEDPSADAYITKFDSDGNHLWAVTWGGGHWLGDSSSCVDTDSANNIYATGIFRGTADFDPDPIDEDIHISKLLGGTSVQADAMLVSFDPDGDYRWGQSWGDEYSDSLYGVAVDGNDEVVACGRFPYECDLDPGPLEEWYYHDIDGNDFFVRYDSDGNYIRSTVFDVGDATKITTNSTNQVIVGGNFGGTAQFDPDGIAPPVTANGTRDSFVSVFEPDGTLVWANAWDSIATGDSTSGFFWEFVAVDTDDNVYYNGHFTGTADLDPDPFDVDEHVSGGGRDSFITKFDSTGDQIWSRSFNGDHLEDGSGISIDQYGNVFAGGYYYSTNTDWDQSVYEYIVPPSNNGSTYLIKLDPDGYW